MSRPCSLCFENCEYFGAGSCGHTDVCWLCSLRLRWICKDARCAICKEPWERMSIVDACGDAKISSPVGQIEGVSFFSHTMLRKAKTLLGYYCSYGGSCDVHFRSLRDLQTHLKRDHDGVLFCDVCLDFRQAFLPEQTLFKDIAALQEHYRTEHAICEFCKHTGKKFYSPDELLVHMNQAHFRCTVCDRLDFQNEYYADFDAFSSHCAEAHFPCEFSECKEQRIVAFPDSAELKLHCIEKHNAGGNRVIPMGNFAENGNGRKKSRNRFPQSHLSSHVHFRGPKRAATVSETAQPPVHAYSEDPTGAVYDKRRHGDAKKICAKNFPADLRQRLESKDFLRLVALAPGSDEYKRANVSFLKKLESVVAKEKIEELKNLSRKFRQDGMSALEFLAEATAVLPDSSLLAELVALLPDEERKSKLIEVVRFDAKKVSAKPAVVRPVKSRSLAPIPHDLFAGSPPGDKKPSLLHALCFLLDDAKSSPTRPLADAHSLPQATLSAMEHKVNSLDRIQLTTLSEMRSHLLQLAEGRDSKLSWAHAEAVIALRPLLYRLMFIPESHRARQAELEAVGWTEFERSTNELFSDKKFTKTELVWMKAYITLSLLRLDTLGPQQAARMDFPQLDNPPPKAVVAPAPTRGDFPNILRVTSAVSSGRQWQNDIGRLRTEQAFPDLPTTVPARAPSPTVNAPWQCPRCTYNNTRALSTECDICGMAKPEGGANIPAEPTGRPQRPQHPNRVRHKIVLSSATQRDYTR